MNNAERNSLWKAYDNIDRRYHQLEDIIERFQMLLESNPPEPDRDYLVHALEGYRMFLEGLKLQRSGIQKIIEG